MSLRAFILGSVAINLVLVATLLFQTARQREIALPDIRLTVVTNRVNEPAPGPAAPAPVTKVAGSPPFHWQQVESTNLLVVATNLLAIGCPAETALDLLEARLADDFRGRLRTLLRPFNARFWDLAATDGKLEDLVKGAAVDQPVEELSHEQARLQKALRQVLQVPAAKPAARSQTTQYRHLPAEKQQQLQALEARQTEERNRLRTELAKLPAAERPAKLKEVRDRQQAGRSALLDPGELAELELRRSPQATRVRELRGFNATPAELRSLALKLKEFDAAHPNPPRPDPGSGADPADFELKRARREAERKELLLAQLGEPRFATYERGGDPRFNTLLKLARRLEIPATAAVQWLEIQNATQQQAAATRQNDQLDAATRAATLAAIRAVAEQALRTAVGARGWTAYQRYAGDWLTRLER